MAPERKLCLRVSGRCDINEKWIGIDEGWERGGGQGVGGDSSLSVGLNEDVADSGLQKKGNGTPKDIWMHHTRVDSKRRRNYVFSTKDSVEIMSRKNKRRERKKKEERLWYSDSASLYFWQRENNSFMSSYWSRRNGRNIRSLQRHWQHYVFPTTHTKETLTLLTLSTQI